MFEQDAWGRTRLHWEALDGDLDAVIRLMNKGWSMYARDGDRMTPFRLAVRANNLDVVKYFVCCGAKVTRMQIMDAEKRGYTDMSNFLKEKFIDQLAAKDVSVPQQVVRGVFSEEQLLRAQSFAGK